MPDLKRARNRLKFIAAALIVLDAIAVATIMTPLAGMQQTRQQELRQLWQELKSREYAPWRGLDKKIPRAKEEINNFFQDRFPDKESAISSELGRLASETGVRVSGNRYIVKDAPIEGLERVEISANLSGDYLQLVRFINALERSRLFFIVDSLDLGGEQSGTVALQIKVETYLRSI